MDLDDVIRGIEQLLDVQEEEVADDPGERNFRCVDCNACYDCRFSERCEACSECTYCMDCVECNGCTQCRRCLSCEGCSYCQDSRECTGSRYLTLCVDCADCVHCLGCVGLSGAEFHVLNEKLPRREYFELLKRVQIELATRAERGWRPAVIGLEPDEEMGTAEWASGHASLRDPQDDGSPWLETSSPEPETPAWLPEESQPSAASNRPGTGSDEPVPPPRSEPPDLAAPQEHDGNDGDGREGLRRGRRPPRRS